MPYTAETIIIGQKILVFLQDTKSFDDPLMTGTYLDRQAGVFIIINPNNPDSMDIDKLGEMINLSTHKNKN
jgi:histidinol-phosphate/aromatic aminotransferase/cobyric acid decarboxylase-like protein